MDRVKLGAYQGVLISVIFTMILSAIVWLSADTLPGFFALSDKAADYCESYLQTIALTVIVLSLYVPLFGFFQGTKHSLIPTVVALCALGLRVAVTYLFKESGYFGHTIIWWNTIFGFGTGCILSWIFYAKSCFRWRLIKCR